MSKITLRVAKKDDAKKLLAIYAYYIKNTAVAFEYDPPSLSEFEKRLRKPIFVIPFLLRKGRGRYWAIPMLLPIKNGRLMTGRLKPRSILPLISEEMAWEGCFTKPWKIAFSSRM